MPRITDDTDLRNDFAGSSLQQRESILLRYLESLPAEDQVDLDTLRENITRRYPFHGDGSFREAMDALEKDGWIKVKNGLVQLDKVARVTRRFLARSMSGGTR